jgi:predicted Rossmann-fold nucleotide-binding protein
MHRKPIVLVDVEQYWDGLLRLLDRAVDESFLRPANRDMVQVVHRVDSILEAIEGYRVEPRPKWIDETQT